MKCRSTILVTAVCALAAYFIVPVALLRWKLSTLIFSNQRQDITHEAQRFEVAVAPKTSLVVRRYGLDSPSCVFFFPGQHGGVATYEKTLFPSLLTMGVRLYVISYPGQDGAQGRSDLATLAHQVDSTVQWVAQKSGCRKRDSLFLGRSFGATIALLEAEKFKPRGVIVDGLGANLAVVIRAHLARNLLLSPWRLLPIERILGVNAYPVGPMFDRLSATAITVFQGTDDDVTPFDAALQVANRRSNVTFHAVPGGRHDDTYLLAKPQYLDAIRAALALGHLDG
ncbi:alpha/beta hydrolase [Luteibacter sp. ME-Dv--P-043b]|uniref:alpha/beta hydrolase n=1 Tax=Luteibacter sp. ME-Dv--P-043b TaxID=3040291 RepID=UPI0025533DA1|nr:alpha/beta hydrolase [Luteibacter sp. ME-Dv--P-043b]